MVFHFKITPNDKKIAPFYLTTKNNNPMQFLYVWKRKTKPTYKFSHQLVDNVPRDEELFENKYDKIIAYIHEHCNNKNTAGNYVRQFKKFVNAGHDGKSVEDIKKFYYEMPIHSRESFCYGMMRVARYYDDEDLAMKILEMGRTARGQTAIERIENMKQPEAVTTMTMEQLRQKAKAVPSDQTMNKFIAELYCMEAWRGTTIIHFTKDKKQTDKNIIFLLRKQLQLNNYKTHKQYGQKNLDISKELASLFRKQFKNTGSDMIFPNMTTNQLSKIVNKIFGIGIKEIRHVHLTHARKSLSNEDFVKKCSRMNTSSTTGLTVYNDTKQ